MFGDITTETIRDTEGNRYGYIDHGGWTIDARKFVAPIREDFHYFGAFGGVDYVGPCNTAADVWARIVEIRAETRPRGFSPQCSACGGYLLPCTETPSGIHPGYRTEDHAELERASIIAQARREDAQSLDTYAAAASPGRFEGADDLALTVAIDIICGHGFSDAQAGDVQYGLHGYRLGRFVLWSDDRGFCTLETFGDDAAAQDALDKVDAEQPNEFGDDC